jgi:DNA-binding MarR family transcriptional regulator
LKLTSAGRAAVPRLRENATGVAQRMLGGFSAEEVEDLRRYLERVIENGQPGSQGGEHD